MSARRASIDRTMTLASFGGPAGASAGAAVATADAGDAGALGADAAVATESVAAGCGPSTCGDGWGGSFEQATASAAAQANAADRNERRRIEGANCPERPPRASSFSGLDRDLQLVAQLEILLADAEEDDFLNALLGRNAR